MMPPDSDPDAAPFNPLPPVVAGLVIVVLGIELLFTAGARGLIGGPDAVGWRLAAAQNWAFSDAIFEWMRENRRWEPAEFARLVTYTLIHGSFTHALFVCVFLLAIGKVVGEVFGSLAFLLVFFVSAALGALFYALVLDTDVPLLGGYPGVYGLIGAFTFMMWANLTAVGENRARAFTLIGVLLGIQLLFSLFVGGTQIWIADLAGFAVGFAMSFVLRPGGVARILGRIRRR